jgi:beta-lactam-binding protein with PASTA domain
MTVVHRSRQKGITFVGLVVVGSLIAMAGVVAAQIFPTVVERSAIEKAVNVAAAGSTVVEIRSGFDRQAAIDDIKSVSGKDIEITKEGDKVVVSYSYQREIHLTGPAYLTLKYAGRSK